MLLIFALTGQYMQHAMDLPKQPFDAQRMMYRASHLYLLAAGVTNVLTGCYFVACSGALVWLQRVGSSLLIFSQPTLLAAFALEPPITDTARNWTTAGMVALLAGTVLTLLATHWPKRPSPPDK